jgi:hypothetical protein
MAQNFSTLSKFGVPIDGVNQGVLHPKQKYRFRVVWYNFGENFGLREMTANVMTCTRPKVTYEEVKLDSYNSVVWIQGKHSFDAIEIKLRDDITNSVITSVGAQVQKQMNHFEQTSAVAGINYKFAMEIHSLDGTVNEELESWYLEGCFINVAQYGDGDYSSGDPQEVTLTIRFDNAVNLAGPNTNEGMSVGGDPYPTYPFPYSPAGGAIAT